MSIKLFQMAEPISGKTRWRNRALSDVTIEYEDKTKQDVHTFVLRTRLPLLIVRMDNRCIHGTNHKMDTFSRHVMHQVLQKKLIKYLTSLVNMLESRDQQDLHTEIYRKVQKLIKETSPGQKRRVEAVFIKLCSCQEQWEIQDRHKVSRPALVYAPMGFYKL